MTKNKIFRNAISITLALFLTLGAIPFSGMGDLNFPSFGSITAKAAEEYSYQNLKFRLENKQAIITGYKDIENTNTYIIPEYVYDESGIDYKVVSIDDKAFENLKTNKLVIPESIHTLGYAFLLNSTVEDVEIKGRITEAKRPAFQYDGPFYNSNVKKVTMHYNHVTNWLFANGSKISEIEFLSKENNETDKISMHAFMNCSSLESIKLSEGIAAIEEHAFDGCPLTEIKIPDSVKSIGNYAFANTKIKKLTIPENVTSLGYAFLSGSPATEVDIKGRISSSGTNSYSGAFYNSSVEKVTMAYNNVPYCLFAEATTLNEVEFLSKEKNETDKISMYAFVNCSSLESIKLPEGITEIGQYAFSNSALTEIEIPESTTKMGNYVFYNCDKIEYVHINSKLKLENSLFTNSTTEICTSDIELYNYLINQKTEYKITLCNHKPVTPDVPVNPVLPELIDAESIALNYKGSVSIAKKEFKDYEVTYESSDSSIITVDEEGKITAVGNGTATITATVTVDGEVIRDEVTVTSGYAWWQWIIVIILFGWIWY